MIPEYIRNQSNSVLKYQKLLSVVWGSINNLHYIVYSLILFFFAGKVIVNIRLANLGAFGDLVHTRALKAVAVKNLFGSAEYFFHRFLPAGAWRFLRGQRLANSVHNYFLNRLGPNLSLV